MHPHPLGGSRWAVERRQRRGGVLADLDLAAHRRLVDLVAGMVACSLAGEDGPLDGAHDVSSGGLGVALAEMAIASGCGLVAGGGPNQAIGGHAELFTELPSRIVVSTHRTDEVLAAAHAAGVAASVVGTAGGDRLVVGDLVDVAVSGLRSRWSEALPALFD